MVAKRKRHITKRTSYEYFLDSTPTLGGVVVTGESYASDSTRQITRFEAVNLVHEVYGVGTWLENKHRAARPEGLELRCSVLRAVEVAA